MLTKGQRATNFIERKMVKTHKDTTHYPKADWKRYNLSLLSRPHGVCFIRHSYCASICNKHTAYVSMFTMLMIKLKKIKKITNIFFCKKNFSVKSRNNCVTTIKN